MALDGYQQSTGVWVDRFGNQLTYFTWGAGEPSHPESARYLEILSPHLSDKWNDEFGDAVRNVVCMKCSGYYPIPSNYYCHDSDFGTVVVKAHSHLYGPKSARDKCTSDASYLHLPFPANAAQNQWYKAYSEAVGFDAYWLGISDVDVEGEWRTDKGDLQTYFIWANGQPNNYQYNSDGGQDYIHATVSEDGMWNDESSEKQYGTLCTYTIEGTSP